MIWNIKGHCVEFDEEEHSYICDGVLLPSITQILKLKFGNKYSFVPEDVMKKASDKGTEVHKVIEDFCKNGVESDLIELKNFKFLQEQFKFEVVDNEVPIILFVGDCAVACGRLDLVLKDGEKFGLGDIKRTSILDKEYLSYQLNLYRIGFQQCYDQKIEFLKGLHLREDARKYVDIKIDEQKVYKLLIEFLEGE